MGTILRGTSKVSALAEVGVLGGFSVGLGKG